MKKLKRIAQVLFVMALIGMPLVALALPTPTPPVSGNEVTLSQIEQLILRIVTFLVTFGIIVAVGFIIWGGIRWVAAMGNDDAVKKARQTVLNGIIGAAIILGVGVILRTLAALITRDFFFR